MVCLEWLIITDDPILQEFAVENDHTDKSQDFVARVNAAQQGLYAYILSLVPNAHDARDILAETNMALWRKRKDFDAAQDFWPWACRFGKMQVLAFRKRRQRDRLVFSEDVINLLAEEAEPAAARNDKVLDAMDDCLNEIDDRRQGLLRLRYTEEISVNGIAASVGRTAGATADLLYRIRLQLAGCIERKLAAGEQTNA